MSQNQSYFWQTTRHNVYVKRAAKLQMLLALLSVLTFSTICVAEFTPRMNDVSESPVIGNKFSGKDGRIDSENMYDAGLELPNQDAQQAKPNSMHTGFIDGFTASISVILVTELGDKTFFIAAIMAMRHPRLVVFTGAITALALMTILSVVFGMAATIIPKIYTYYISTALFAIFGFKMIYDGYFMKDSDAQEELEEVQSNLRKREDELMRSKRNKYDDADAKRKNSNSDKEDCNADRNGGVIGSTITSNNNSSLPNHKNPEMQHRQRKQTNYNNNNNNNNNNINRSNSIKNKTKKHNGCESNNEIDSDSNDCRDSAVFLDDVEHVKLSTFHSSPALSGSISSENTNQTNCDEMNLNDTPHRKGRHIPLNGAAMVHSASASAALVNGKLMNGDLERMGSHNNSINSINSLSINSMGNTAGQSTVGELNEYGGNNKRLERDVSAALVQDPESGVVRKNTKKGAAYLTTRIMMQAFTMTFLAEWGDRSQLTTIILAASKNIYGVIAGGIIGHSICTGLAVIGGRMVAAKISVRTVTIVGGVVFLGFAVYALIVRPDDI